MGHMAGRGSVADCRRLRGRACAGPWHGSSEPCRGFAFPRLSATVSGRQRAHEPRSDHGMVRPNHGMVRSNHCMVRPNHGTVRSNRGVASLPGRAIWDGGGGSWQAARTGEPRRQPLARAVGSRRRRVGDAELETRPASPTRMVRPNHGMVRPKRFRSSRFALEKRSSRRGPRPQHAGGDGRRSRRQLQKVL